VWIKARAEDKRRPVAKAESSGMAAEDMIFMINIGSMEHSEVIDFDGEKMRSTKFRRKVLHIL